MDTYEGSTNYTTEPVDVFYWLNDLTSAALHLKSTPVPDGAVADVAGRVQHVERTLGAFRRSLLAEQDREVNGSEYGIRSGGRVASRTYSTVGITSSFMDALALDFAGVLFWLRERDALRLTWRWSELQQAFDAADVQIRKEHHEVADDDWDAHVGEVWSEKPMVIVALEEPS